jgi:fused signal recognition particle receptor
VEELRRQSKLRNLQTREEVIDCLCGILAGMMVPNEGLKLGTKPSVILMVGVNGSGKTTSIAKLAQKLKDAGEHDPAGPLRHLPRRAADPALDLGRPRGAEIVTARAPNADPASVAHDACQRALSRHADVMISTPRAGCTSSRT